MQDHPRVLMRGSDVPSMRNQTVRVEIVNANALQARRDVMVHLVLDSEFAR